MSLVLSILLLCCWESVFIEVQVAASPPLNGLPVLILDVDGTLYENECAIEQQIRNNYRVFAKESLDVDAAECTFLREQYGSTVRGLSVKFGSRDIFVDYYNDAYPHVDMSRLLKYTNQYAGRKSTNPVLDTGYSFPSRIPRALAALHDIAKDTPIVIASNSPIFHVKRVLTRLGLANLNVSAFLTPERLGGLTKVEPEFWAPIFDLYPKDQYICTLVDDNEENCVLVRKMGMNALKLDSELEFDDAIREFILDCHNCDSQKLRAGKYRSFRFDELKYLEAKNEVDAASFNQDVWKRLMDALLDRMLRKQQCNQQGVVETFGDDPGLIPADRGANNAQPALATSYNAIEDDPFQNQFDGAATTLRVLDIGAGLLNMFSRISQLLRPLKAEQLRLKQGTPIQKLHYIALETNSEVLSHAAQTLEKAGLRLVPFNRGGMVSSEAAEGEVEAEREREADSASPPVSSTIRQLPLQLQYSGTISGVKVTVDLCAVDFMSPHVLPFLRNLIYAHDISIFLQQSQQQLERRKQQRPPRKVGLSPFDLFNGESSGYLESEWPEAEFNLKHNDERPEGFDLVVGACVADLHPPRALASQIIHIASDAGGLLYLPITFNGKTKLSCVKPTSTSSGLWGGLFGGLSGSSRNPGKHPRPPPLLPKYLSGRTHQEHPTTGSEYFTMIDEDTKDEIEAEAEERAQAQANAGTDDDDAGLTHLFDIYHRYLAAPEQGHHLHAQDLVAALNAHGCRLLLPPSDTDSDTDSDTGSGSTSACNHIRGKIKYVQDMCKTGQPSRIRISLAALNRTGGG